MVRSAPLVEEHVRLDETPFLSSSYSGFTKEMTSNYKVIQESMITSTLSVTAAKLFFPGRGVESL
jgi:glucose-6-phosphate isomerase